jgi:outer membrane receptor protein involved in Fe transport
VAGDVLYRPLSVTTLSVLIAASVALPAVVVHAGTLTGTVVDDRTGEALLAAEVVVEGTGLGGIANRDGEFRIEGIPEGSRRIVASMMGYETQRIEVTIVSDGDVTASFRLIPQVLDIGLEVVVTGESFESLPDKPTSHKTLTSQEIRRAPGGMEDVFRVLQTMPGIGAVDMTTSDIVVRGGNPMENRTLLENIKIPSPLHFGRPGGRMGGVSIVHPGLIEEVDFMTGGFPARYGDKMSSVFEMKLKEGSTTEVSTDVNLNLAGFSVVVDGPVSGGGTMVCSVRRGVFDFLTEAVGLDALPAYWDVVGKLTYNVGSSHKFSLLGLYYPDDLSIGADPLGQSRHGEWSELELERQDRGGAVGLNWRAMLGERGYLLTTASRVTNAWSTRRGLTEGRSIVGDDIREDEVRITSDLNYRLSDRISLRTGLCAEQIESDYTAWSAADTTVTGDVIPGYDIDYDPPAAYKLGSYVQTTVQPLDRVSLTAGVRYDYYDLTGEKTVSPRLGAVLSLTDRTSVSAAYGHYYQTAAPYQVAQHTDNEELRSSLSIHKVVGLAHQLSDDTRVTLEVYHKDLWHGFVHDRATRITTNDGSGIARGIEFCVQKRMGRRLVGSVAYAYSVAKLRDREDLSEYYSEFDRPHNLTIVGSYRISDGWQVGAKFNYASGAPYTPVTEAEQRDGIWYMLRGEKHSARYPDYHMLDIRVDRTFRLGGWTLMAYLDVWSVYSQRNVTLYGFEVDEDGTVRKLTADDGLPGALPILGIEMRF